MSTEKTSQLGAPSHYFNTWAGGVIRVNTPDWWGNINTWAGQYLGHGLNSVHTFQNQLLCVKRSVHNVRS